MKMRVFIILCLILCFGCSSNKTSQKDHSMFWHKNSAEYKALCLQAYNIAKKKLDLELSKKHDSKTKILKQSIKIVFLLYDLELIRL